MTEALARFLSAELGWERPFRVEQLPGGTSPGSQKLWLGQRPFVLRVRADNGATWRPGFATEVSVWSAAAAAGIAPALVAADESAGFALGEYVAAQPLAAAQLEDVETWQRVRGLLDALHALEVPDAKAYSPLRAAEHYGRVLAAAGVPFPQLAELRELAAEFSAPLSGIAHNDLVPENLLVDGKRLWLIDYEFAGRGATLLDWASLVAFGRRPPAGFAAGLAGEQLARATRLVRLLALAWLIALRVSGEADDSHAMLWERLQSESAR